MSLCVHTNDRVICLIMSSGQLSGSSRLAFRSNLCVVVRARCLVSRKDVQRCTIAMASATSGNLGPAACGWARRGQACSGRSLLSCLALSARALGLLLLNV